MRRSLRIKKKQVVNEVIDEVVEEIDVLPNPVILSVAASATVKVENVEPTPSSSKKANMMKEKIVVAGTGDSEDGGRSSTSRKQKLPPSISTNQAIGGKRKRQRLSADQRTILDASTILEQTKPTPSINPLCIDHVIDCVFSFIFPGPQEAHYNLKDVCNFRLVSKSWNRAGVRLMKRHCRIGVGKMSEPSDPDQGNSSNAEHDIEEELTLPVLPISLTLTVEKMREYTRVMKKSPDIPFVMYSFRESLFQESNSKALVSLLQICGPSMEQLLVTMEPSTCTMSFLTPYFNLSKLKRLKLMMKHSKTDYTTSAVRQFKVSDRIYPIDGINGIYFLQSLCNGSTSLERLDIHWMPTLIPWSSTFGLKDLFLPTTINKLTLDTMNTDGTTVKNLLLHKDIKLSTLKWSIGLPLQSLTEDDVTQCLKRHAKSLRSLYFSIWISRLHHEGTKLVDFPVMENVEQLSLMGDGGQITPFSFPKVFPKLSSLTLYHQMLDFLEEAIPSKTVKVVRILGAPIRCDVRTTLSKTFPALETLILFPQRDLHSKEYLVSMFLSMKRLRILLSHISKSDLTSIEASSNNSNKEEDLPGGLYMRSYRRSTYIVRIESGSTEVTKAVAEALEHLDSISRNPPFTLDAAAFSYL
ncbi:Ribosomal RNA large subunit methyltransferase H [Orchesella cincta]|uniref:Ribosomal RNA large subunit methyltransferase H n=1 Tax=Orchesella cincta TaxID=48709 RepID=A0A1D2MRJ3_ORCCI|nr:Ribosomal RNA large subunit methyltransferase H [Orchesella cincta]